MRYLDPAERRGIEQITRDKRSRKFDPPVTEVFVVGRKRATPPSAEFEPDALQQTSMVLASRGAGSAYRAVRPARANRAHRRCRNGGTKARASTASIGGPCPQGRLARRRHLLGLHAAARLANGAQRSRIRHMRRRSRRSPGRTRSPGPAK